MLEERNKQVPFIIFELGRVFNPIQGLFNVLVYTRPFVRGLRTHHPEYSWWKAFILTVKRGGDNNAPRQRNNSSTKRNEKVLEKIQQNHVQMMADIRKSRRASMFNSSFRSSTISSSSLRKSSNGASFHMTETNPKDTSRLDLDVDTCKGSDDQQEQIDVEVEAPSTATNDDSDLLNMTENNNDNALVDGDKKDVEVGITSVATSE